jgi:hypothetical protein
LDCTQGITLHEFFVFSSTPKIDDSYFYPSLAPVVFQEDDSVLPIKNATPLSSQTFSSKFNESDSDGDILEQGLSV